MYPILGIVILILDLYCIYLILVGSAPVAEKLLWIVLVLLLPLIGPVLYLLIGRKGAV